MCEMIIFGGTTEGRRLAEFCAEHQIMAYISVVSEYGAGLLPESDCLHILEKRMDALEMEAFFKKNNIKLVIDATHPHAKTVTENINNVCNKMQLDCFRVIRALEEPVSDARYFDRVEDAAAYLKAQEEKKAYQHIFITTGSKELSAFCALTDFERRCIVRVLDSAEAVDNCRKLGFLNSHILSLRGSFTKEQNQSQFLKYRADVLVTKDSGAWGGFREKIEAAKACGMEILVVRRPKEEGVTLEEMCELLQKEKKKEVSVIGIGMDGEQTLTKEAYTAVSEAALLIGGGRMLACFSHLGKEQFISCKPREIADYIEDSGHEKIAVLMSGDIGFYSGAKKLLPLLTQYRTKLICGISAPVYFAAKLGVDWQDMHFVSLHGLEANVVREVATHKKTFFLLGSSTPAEVCNRLACFGFGDMPVAIGVCLSTPEERIYRGRASEYTDLICDSLCVMLVTNENWEQHVTCTIPDKAFLRNEGASGAALIPMTKSEVRCVCMSKLAPESGNVCWDVGCGTGSVSVELALRCGEGRVYAIDKNPAAIVLTDQNRHRFHCDNIELLEGEAGALLPDLPAPDVVFIGGSSGALAQIITIAYEKNPDVRLLLTAVSIETLTESTAVFAELGRQTEITQLAVTHTGRVGGHTMLRAENPVFIIEGLR